MNIDKKFEEIDKILYGNEKIKTKEAFLVIFYDFWKLKEVEKKLFYLEKEAKKYTKIKLKENNTLLYEIRKLNEISK